MTGPPQEAQGHQQRDTARVPSWGQLGTACKPSRLGDFVLLSWLGRGTDLTSGHALGQLSLGERHFIALLPHLLAQLWLCCAVCCTAGPPGMLWESALARCLWLGIRPDGILFSPSLELLKLTKMFLTFPLGEKCWNI